jgi:hypothetical protein
MKIGILFFIDFLRMFIEPTEESDGTDLILLLVTGRTTTAKTSALRITGFDCSDRATLSGLANEIKIALQLAYPDN